MPEAHTPQPKDVKPTVPTIEFRPTQPGQEPGAPSVDAYNEPEGTEIEKAATLLPREIHATLRNKLRAFTEGNSIREQDFYSWQAQSHSKGGGTKWFADFVYPQYQKEAQPRDENEIVENQIQRITSMLDGARKKGESVYLDDFLRLARKELRNMMSKKPSNEQDYWLIQYSWDIINQRTAIIFNNIENRIKGITTKIK